MNRWVVLVYNAAAMRRLILALALLLAVPLSGEGSHVPVETLLQRMFVDERPAPYEVTSEFDGALVISWRAGRITARAAGSSREWRAAYGQPRRREINITTLEVPLLLRPFTGGLKDLIQDRVEREEGTLSLLEEYDVFIQEELPNNRFLLAGVRSDIVTDIMRRYGRASDMKDVAVRRAVARWLYQPRQKELTQRPGGPYLVTVLLDDLGAYYSVLLTYDWGPVGWQIDWMKVNDRLVWREVKMDASTDLRGFGHLDGVVNLRFSNHCFNCRR